MMKVVGIWEDIVEVLSQGEYDDTEAERLNEFGVYYKWYKDNVISYKKFG